MHTINHLVSNNCSVLKQYPLVLPAETVLSLIYTLDGSVICRGNSDKRFVDLAKGKKGKFTTIAGGCIATLEDRIGFNKDGEEFYCTVRHVDCEILSSSMVCTVCTSYRNTLRALLCKQKRIGTLSTHPKMNTRFLRTPQRNAHIKSLKAAICNKNRQLKRIKCKLEEIVEDDGIVVDDELEDDLKRVTDDHSMDAESVRDEFKQIFLQQQVNNYV